VRAEVLPAASAKPDSKIALDKLARHFAATCSLPPHRNAAPPEMLEKLRTASASSSAADAPFDEKTVAAACASLRKPKSAVGPDGISGRFLKHAGPTVIACITLLLNYSWQHGVVPRQWREANIIPLFKESQTDRADPNNYRPISLTSVLCKLCERIILARLWKLAGDRISRRQFGFRRGHSTLDGLLFLDHHVRLMRMNAVKTNNWLSVCFLDISKAFDRAWHAGLLQKLADIGVTGNAWRWCRAFLSDRRLRTTQDGLNSDWFSFNAGVPQGSVLSPFLFLVFINDLQDAVNHREPSDRIQTGRAIASLYADDLALIPLSFGKTGDAEVQEALEQLGAWADKWRVTFNVSKSKVLCFTSRRNVPSVRVFLNGDQLQQVLTFDYLGLRWQENGKWDEHFEKVALSATRVAGFITSLLHATGPPASVIRQLCHALIRTKILYGMPVWQPSSDVQWQRLDSILAEPMRRCLGLPKSTHIKSLLVEMNTLWTKRQFDVLAVATCSRALSQPRQHQSHTVVQSQLDWRWPFEQRQPIPHVARRAATELKAPSALDRKQPSMPPQKQLVNNALALQRVEWRKSGHGRSLYHLMPIGPRTPSYLFKDPRPAAIVRARLRFDRSHLAESRRRRGVQLDSIICARCNLADNLGHFLNDCQRNARARKEAFREAELAGLPTAQPHFGLWTLGYVESMPNARANIALAISAKFLLASRAIRKL